jgi:hypothetical protein
MIRAMRLPLAAVVCLLGCERASDATDPVKLPLPVVQVDLVDSGIEPREPIRLESEVAAGSKWTSRHVWTIAGEHRPTRTITETYDVEMISQDGGEAHTRATLRNVTVDPAPTTYDPKLHVGDTIDSWRDRRGVHTRPSLMRTHDKEFEPNPSRPELLVIAPEESVGVGARWHEVIDQGGARANVNVELLARDTDKIRERLTFHTERWIKKLPASVDGTATLETALHGIHGSASGSSTVVVHDPDHGDIQLHETIEDVAGP